MTNEGDTLSPGGDIYAHAVTLTAGCAGSGYELAPVRVDCGCGTTHEITVRFDQHALEAAAHRVLLGMQRKAAYQPQSRLRP